MALLQLFAFAVFLSALVGRGAPFMDKKVMEEMQERLKRLRDVPGFDPDEYKRYWDEMLKNDPRKKLKIFKLTIVYNFVVIIWIWGSGQIFILFKQWGK
jgi:hypothetical protein